MFLSLISKKKAFDKTDISSIFCCQDVVSHLLELLQGNESIPVPTMKLTRTRH